MLITAAITNAAKINPATVGETILTAYHAIKPAAIHAKER